jgi:AcrR family transcriptional regulator
MKRHKRQYHHGSLRAALLESTARLVAERGRSAVSLREAARRVGVSEAAPYQHVADKSALLTAVADAGFELLDASLSEALESTPANPVGQLEALAVAYLRFALDRPQYFRLMFGQPADIRRSAAASAARLFDRFVESVRAARLSHGHDDEDPPTTATLLWSVPHGLASLYLEGSMDAEIAPRALEDLVRAGVRALVAAPLPEVGNNQPQWGI